MAAGMRWVTRNREGNEIYLTQERWEHITHPANHPDMLVYEEELKRTIQQGRRTQDESNPQKYRYRQAFTDLPEMLPILSLSFCFGFVRSKAIDWRRTTIL